jgi:hypothetical protein
MGKGIITNYGTAKRIAKREELLRKGIKFRGYDINRIKFVRRIGNKGIKTKFQIIETEANKEKITL